VISIEELCFKVRYLCATRNTVQRYSQNIRIVIVLLFAFLSTLSYGQVLQWSNPTKLKGAAVFTKVISENESGVFLLRYRNRLYSKNIVIDRYSHRLVLQDSRVIDLKKARLVKIYATSKGLLIIKSKINKATQNNELLAQWYSYDLRPIDETVLLAQSPIREFGDRGNFRLRISDNLAHIALIYTERTPEKEVLLHYSLMNISLQEIAHKDVQIAVQYERFMIQDLILGNEKELFMLTGNIGKERNKKVQNHYSLYHLQDSVLYDFPLPDSLSVKSAFLTYDRVADNARVTGFFGESETYGVFGTFFYQLTEQRDSAALVVSEFTDRFVNEVNINNRNGGAISEGFNILDAIPRSDGGIMLIAEQEDIATEDDIILVNGIPQSTSKNIYNFNELLVLNYDAEGFMDWNKLIIKNQTTVNDAGYYSSIVIFVGEKFVQLLYNDQLRSSGDVMQYTIYNNGYVEANKLLKAQLDYVAIIPSEAKQVSSNKVIIPTSKNRRFALLKLSYP
jgi:hypothetical protein